MEKTIIDECHICLEELTGELTVLSCNHHYHYDCIKQWLNKNNKIRKVCCVCDKETEIVNIYYSLSGPNNNFCVKNDNINTNTINTNTINTNKINTNTINTNTINTNAINTNMRNANTINNDVLCNNRIDIDNHNNNNLANHNYIDNQIILDNRNRIDDEIRIWCCSIL